MSFINKFFSNKNYGVIEPNQIAVIESDEEKSAKYSTPVLYEEKIKYEKKIEKEWRTITAYKGMNKDMVCRDMTYELGQTYAMPSEEVSICANGYHACIQLADVASYYSIFTSRFFEVEIEYCPDDIYDYYRNLYGYYTVSVLGRADSKIAGRRISILRELSEEEIYKGFHMEDIMSFETFLEWRQDNKGLSDGGIIDSCKVQKFQEVYEQVFGYAASDNVDGFLKSLGFNFNSLDKAIKVLKSILEYHIEAPVSVRMMIFYKRLGE